MTDRKEFNCRLIKEMPMATVTNVKQKRKFLLEGRGLALFLIFFVALAAFMIASFHYHNLTHYTVSPSDTLIITGSPGELIYVDVNAGTSVNGLWASSGLTLSLNSPAHFSAPLIASKEVSWSDTILTETCLGCSPDASIDMPGWFVIPTTLTANAPVITGQIAGDVIYPADQGFAFSDTTDQLAIPVRLTLESSTTTFTSGEFPLYLVTGADVLLLLAVPALFRLYDIRRKPGLLLGQ
jgi:hypothetical protein